MKFVDKPMRPDERLMDPTLETKFEKDSRYHMEIMRLMIEEHYKLVAAGAIVKPDEVINATRAYIEEQDVVRAFIADRLDVLKCLTAVNCECANCRSYVRSTQLFDAFRKWCTDNHKDARAFKPEWFKQQMNKERLPVERCTRRIPGLHGQVVCFGVKLRPDPTPATDFENEVDSDLEQ